MSRRTWTLVAVVLGSGIVFLDSTIVNVALRAIGDELPTSMVGVLEGQSYVVNGYLLTLSALLILAGALADRYGRRRLFVIGLAGFGAASLACGLAPTMEILIGRRARAASATWCPPRWPSSTPPSRAPSAAAPSASGRQPPAP